MFLRRIPYQSVRRRHIRNWPLLLLRLAALALIVAGVRASVSPDGVDRRRRCGRGARSRHPARPLVQHRLRRPLGACSRMARDRINELGASDRASIVFFDTGAEVALRSTSDKGRLASAVSAGKVSAAATKFGPALKLAGSILSESALTNREVVLISDFQRAGWLGAEGVRLPDGAMLVTASVATDQRVECFRRSGGSAALDVQRSGADHRDVRRDQSRFRARRCRAHPRSRRPCHSETDAATRARRLGIGQLRSVYAGVQVHPRHRPDR